MNATWREWSKRYAAMSLREQALIAVATLAAIGGLLTTLWVDPAAGRAEALRRQIADEQAELATLSAQATTLKSQLQDPDAANRKALADLQARLAGVDSQIGHLDDKLVPPERMGKLLQTMLARHRGLSLISLRSLPPEPLLSAPADKAAAEKADKPVARDGTAPRENIYRHGLEIRLAGSYGDLLAYVAEIERAPQRLLRGAMTLTVTTYPRSELTLTVHTLSREREWLSV